MNKIFQKKILTEIKTQNKAMPLVERFDPNAQDGDGDGRVQDSTNYERPAKPIKPSKTIVRLGGAMDSSKRMFPYNTGNNIKRFNGITAKDYLNRATEIVQEVESEFGQLRTLKDAHNALKKIFKRVIIKGYGDADRNTKSDLSSVMSASEKLSIAILLHTVKGNNTLKKRTIVLTRNINDDGSPNFDGATGIMQKDAAQGYLEYGVRVTVPAHDQSGEILSTMDNDVFYDGVANQILLSFLDEASPAQPESVLEEIKQLAGILAMASTSTHEGVHAMHMPSNAEFLEKKYGVSNQAEVIDEIAKNVTDDDIANMLLIDKVATLINSREFAHLLAPIFEYGKDKESSIQTLNNIIANHNAEIVQIDEEIKQLRQVMSTAPAVFQQVISDAINNLMQNKIQMEAFANVIKNILSDAKSKSNYSDIAKAAKVMEQAQFDYAFDFYPVGHPLHGKDIVRTVDKNGDLVPYEELQEEKFLSSSIGVPKDMMRMFLELEKARTYLENLGVPPAVITAFTEGVDGLFYLSPNGQLQTDLSVFSIAIPGTMDRLRKSFADNVSAAELSTLWHPVTNKKTIYKMLDWVRSFSSYGANPSFSYLGPFVSITPDRLVSVEAVAETFTSLLWGGGAINNPTTQDVKQGFIDIFDYLFDGRYWVDKLPAKSLEFLGLK